MLAVAGLSALRRSDETLIRVMGGWILGCAVFLVAGVLTPVDLRHYLAAFPAVAILAGLGAASLWRRGTPGRVVTAVVLAAAMWLAVRDWLRTLA